VVSCFHTGRAVASIPVWEGVLRGIVMSRPMYVCLSVRLSAGISWKPHAQTLPDFCACCLRLQLLGSPLMALEYVVYFRF